MNNPRQYGFVRPEIDPNAYIAVLNKYLAGKTLAVKGMKLINFNALLTK